MKVPFLDLSLVNDGSVIAAIRRVVDRTQYILGPELEAFESEWAAYNGYKHCVGVGNGFDALRLMLQAYGIGTGDEVIVPSNTYVATWMAVSAVGAIPVPVEPDDTYTINPRLIADAITGRTAAVLAVHLYGRECNMDGLRVVCRHNGLQLFTDCAQSHGIKDCGDAGAFSFYPTKNLGCLGDGGAVITNDSCVAGRIKSLRNYGSVVKHVNGEIGWNSRLDEIQAAVLREKLPLLDGFNAIRARAQKIYDESLGARSGKTVNHVYVIEHPYRNGLRRALSKAGIETMIHYPIPPNKQAPYSGYRELPVAERIADRILSLPVLVTEDHARYVAHAVIEASCQWA